MLDNFTLNSDDIAVFSDNDVKFKSLVIDRRDSDELVDEAELRGDVKRGKALARLIKYRFVKQMQIANFSEIGLPDSGDAFIAITSGSFNAYTIVLYAINLFGHIDKLSVTTFDMHQDVISDIFHQFDVGNIGKLDLMLSESIKFRMPKRYIQMQECFDERKHTDRIRVKYNWNHSKIILIRIGNDRYCISGSGNLSDNAQFEQYLISHNLCDYDFFANWIDKDFEEERFKREKILV